MKKEDVVMISFEIVAYAGEARSKLLEALNLAQKGVYDKAEVLIREAETAIIESHKVQTEMIAKDAEGENLELGVIMIHGQDHLMTTILLKDLVRHFIELYKRG